MAKKSLIILSRKYNSIRIECPPFKRKAAGSNPVIFKIKILFLFSRIKKKIWLRI